MFQAAASSTRAEISARRRAVRRRTCEDARRDVVIPRRQVSQRRHGYDMDIPSTYGSFEVREITAPPRLPFF